MAKSSGDPEFLRKAGAVIRAAREATGLSQSQAAERFGMTRSSLANLEAGRQNLTMERLMILAQVVRLDLADLLAIAPAPAAPVIPHKVVIRPVLEILCETCGVPIGAETSRALANEERAAHIAAYLKREAEGDADGR